jgi:hypothetical protein
MLCRVDRARQEPELRSREVGARLPARHDGQAQGHVVSVPVLFFVTVPYAIYLLPDAYVYRLTHENGAFEMLGALALLAAAVMFALTALSSTRSGKTGSRMSTMWFLGLVLFCSLAFMEEISWGQQLLSFHTPDVIKQYNVQSETNLHNLRWFNGVDESGHHRSFWASLFSSERLFNMAWFLGFVVVPVSAAMSSRVRTLCARWSVPLAPVALSSVFVLHYIQYRIIDGLLGERALHITEVSEFNIEILFACVAAAMLSELHRHGSQERT